MVKDTAEDMNHNMSIHMLVAVVVTWHQVQSLNKSLCTNRSTIRPWQIHKHTRLFKHESFSYSLHGSLTVAYICSNCSEGTIEDMCVVKDLDDAFKDVKTTVAGDLLCYSLPIYGFTPKCQEDVKHEENVANFKEQFGVEPRAGKSLATGQINKCSSVSSSNFCNSGPSSNVLRTEFSNIQTREALMILNWLKCYCTKWVIAEPWKVGCFKHLQNIVKDYTDQLGLLKNLT